MNIGFTGSRHGMTDAQRAAFGVLVTFDYQPSTFVHGSCQGADVEAAAIVRHVQRLCRIASRPGPDGDPHQVDSGVDDVKLPGKTHFARNRDIVDGCDVLIACPCDMTEQPRGGTWYTVGYARKNGKCVIIVWPDGSVELLTQKEQV